MNTRSSADQDRIIWLNEHAHPIRSIDPADATSEDLEPLRDLLSNVRIVMLGEASHGDGTTFLAKCRIVRFLHQQLGFDVLAFEAGMAECDWANSALRAAKDPEQLVRDVLPDIWANSEQTKTLFTYIAAQARSAGPLEICGFDHQIEGDRLAQILSHEFDRMFEVHAALLAHVDRASFQKLLERCFGEEASTSEQELGEEIGILDRVIEPLRRDVDPSVPDDREYWLRYLENLRVNLQAGFLWEQEDRDPIADKLRDECMGRNLLWFTQRRFPARRIIVWAGNGHIGRNEHTVRRRTGETAFPGTRSMGDVVREKLGSQSYALAFTACGGKKGYPNSKPRNLKAPVHGGLDDLIERSIHEHALIDFRQLSPGGEWLREELVARPLGYAQHVAVWPEIFDGYFCSRTMVPSTALGARSPGFRI